MRRKYNPRIIRKHRSYATKEVAALLGVHSRTVQNWVSQEGLTPIEGSANPYLIHGEVLAQFLKKRMQSKKCKLGEGESYCFKCCTGRKSLPSAVVITKTDIKIGSKGKFKKAISGLCEVCGTKINLFSTYEKEASTKII